MEEWISLACDYIASWLEFQMRLSRLPGCIAVVMHRDRIASHSKSFTATGIMKLREAGKLRLDDPIGHYVNGLHPQIAETTIGQILSHSAGIVRDGADAGYYEDRRPFPSVDELMADLQNPPVISS